MNPCHSRRTPPARSRRGGPGALVATLLLSLLPTGRSIAGFPGFEIASAASPSSPEPRANSAPSRLDGVRRPSVTALRNEGSTIRVDGHLDDPVWREAPTGGGFRVWSPDRGKEPSEETLFKVAYDDEAVYFAVACLEKDPSNIQSTLSRRDHHRDTDQVSVYLDPYHDRTTGYLFRVNPDAVQEDYFLFNDGDRDVDWDAVWEAETSRDEDGWYAEMRIPFSSIRYRPEERMTWGLQVYRTMHRRGEDTSWATWDREQGGFVSRFGELTGIEGVKAPRQMEVIPYLVQRTTDPGAGADDDAVASVQNAGADLRWAVTPDLTMHATVQPDFGQVEADPATLNLSPFETWYQEKRPFFVEGSSSFEQPEFNLFYSRRIGTGDENARIRFAGKLTGKAAGNFTVGALYAATDVAAEGQAHNLLKSGSRPAQFFVGRIGRDFSEGRHSVHVMQTAALRDGLRETEDADEMETRDGYGTGLDFEMNTPARGWRMSGSFVGTIVDPAAVADDPTIDHSRRRGTGGEVGFQRRSGRIRGSTWGRWESDSLDPNDLGYLQSPDEVNTGGWLQWRYVPGEEPRLNEASVNLNLWRSWLYAGDEVRDDDTGEVLWDYGRGHHQNTAGNINGWMQFRNYWEFWYGVQHSRERTDRFITRGGPLMRRPAETGGWVGFLTDSRRDLSLEVGGDYIVDAAGGLFAQLTLGANWNAGTASSHSLQFQAWTREERADYLDTIDPDEEAGIDGTHWVFGDLAQRTLELTMRSSLLFDRSKSLELYVQPYLTAGDYTNARELVRPDSYDLAPYDKDGFRAEDSDFLLASVNLNLVYRWEYRPGSAFYLVWAHSRSDLTELEDDRSPTARLDNRLKTRSLFANEPENTVLAKLTYWFAL